LYLEQLSSPAVAASLGDGHTAEGLTTLSGLEPLTQAATEAADASKAAEVIVPLGALEQHGPHLPLGTDTFIAREIATRAAQEVGNCQIAPCVPIGASAHHLSFAGTTSIAGETLASAIADILATLLSHGFGAAYLITGHAGNCGAMQAAAASLSPQQAEKTLIFADWPAMRDAVHQVAETQLGMHRDVVGTHAGHFETSIMLAIHPDLVDLSSAAAGYIGPPEVAGPRLSSEGIQAVSPIGVVGDPTLATAAAGELYLDALVGLVTAGIYSHRQARQACDSPSLND